MFMFTSKDTAMWNARVFVMFLVINVISGKRFETRCKLVRELLKIGMPNDMFLGQWVCLIEKVSKRDTSAFLAKPSGKKFYGLYQIPNEWCREKKRGGLCNMTCEGFRTSAGTNGTHIGSLCCRSVKTLFLRNAQRNQAAINFKYSALLDDDIRDDTACALQIAEKNGFQFWSKWTTRCKNDNFITTEIYKCPDLMRLTPERSLSSSSQYQRSPPRLRRSTYKARLISKVTRSQRSRHIN